MATMIQARARYEDDLFAWTQEQASLQRAVPGMIREAYADAVKDAIDETGLRAEVFPGACPYAPDDVLDEDHFPTTDL